MSSSACFAWNCSWVMPSRLRVSDIEVEVEEPWTDAPRPLREAMARGRRTGTEEDKSEGNRVSGHRYPT